MRPDYLFLVPGLLGLVAAFVLLARPRSRIPGLAAFCLACGLLLQAAAPRLTVEGRAVVLSEAERVAPGFSFDRYVNRVRVFQFGSTSLILCGAVGLAFIYGGTLRNHREGGDAPI